MRINQSLTMIDQFGMTRDFSFKDYLTHIYNRRYLYETGENIFQIALRTKVVPILGMIDLDFFKKVNDTYGHDVGDLVLKKVSTVLQNNIRKSDLLARYGGEEFCIIANNMNIHEAERIFNKRRESIAAIDFGDEYKDLHITVSIGLCCELQGSFSEMIKVADENLYKAKKGGRNRVCL